MASDRPAEVRRLVSLGATVHQELTRHTWMRDREGNDVCALDG